MTRVYAVHNYVEKKLGNTRFKKDAKKGKKEGYSYVHSKAVANIALYLATNLQENDISKKEKDEIMRNKEMILIASLLHDIKKDDKNHPKASCEFVKHLLTGTESARSRFNADEINLICQMIEYHNSDDVIQENSHFVNLIQDADKLSRYADNFKGIICADPFEISCCEIEKHFGSVDNIKKVHEELKLNVSKELLNNAVLGELRMWQKRKALNFLNLL